MFQLQFYRHVKIVLYNSFMSRCSYEVLSWRLVYLEIWFDVVGVSNKHVIRGPHASVVDEDGRNGVQAFTDKHDRIVLENIAGNCNNNQMTNGPKAHLRLFVLSKLTVISLKNETYGYCLSKLTVISLKNQTYGYCLSTLTVISLKNQTYGYGRAGLIWKKKSTNLVSVFYSNLVWNLL